MAVVGVAGLVLPIIPGIAFLILAWLMIRSSVTGERVQVPRGLRRHREPISDAGDA